MIFRGRAQARFVLSSLIALSGGGGDGPSNPPGPTTPPTPPPTPSLQAVTTADLGNGWNLGNSLDVLNNDNTPHSTSQETFWGNPAVNQQLLNAIATAGFKSVRMPTVQGTSVRRS